jgi:hypothetical protein
MWCGVPAGARESDANKRLPITALMGKAKRFALHDRRSSKSKPAKRDQKKTFNFLYAPRGFD